MKVETPDICVDQECAKTLTAPFYADTSAVTQCDVCPYEGQGALLFTKWCE